MSTALKLFRLARQGARRAGGMLAEGGLRFIARRLSPPLRPKVDPPRRIFILRNNDLGDVLVATPLLEALARAHPDSAIAIGVGEWAVPILERNPYATARVVPAPWLNKYSAGQTFSDRWRFMRSAPATLALAAEEFDVGIDFAGTRWGALLLRRCAMPVRLGIKGYAGGHSLATATIPFDPTQHVARLGLRFAELLGATELPAPRPQLFLDPAERTLGERAWNEHGGLRLAIAPGGGLEDRRWSAHNFAALASLISRAHPEAELLVLGGPTEEALIGSVLAGGARVRSVTPAPTLRELFAIVAAADAVICNSSVVLHIAAAFERPALVLLGPGFSDPSRHQRQWGYPGLSVTLGAQAAEAPTSPGRAFDAFEQQVWQRWVRRDLV